MDGDVINAVAEDATFKPREVAQITGVSAALLRDWRYRGDIIDKRFDRERSGFALEAVAAILLLRMLRDQGLDPKGASAWVAPLADGVRYFALDHELAWPSAEEYVAWHGVESAPPRFGLLRRGRAAELTDNVAEGFPEWCATVAIVVDLRAIGRNLRSAAGKPLAHLRRPESRS